MSSISRIFVSLCSDCECTKPKTKDPDVSCSTSSLPALATRYSKNNNTSLPGSTGTLPSEKKPGFLKWLSTGKRKGAGSNTHMGTLPPKSPKARKDKLKPGDESGPVIKASSVQHLVADVPESDDIEPAPALPPAMPIVENKFSENGVKVAPHPGSRSSVASTSEQEITGLNGSQAKDFSQEMEDILCEKFPTSTSIKSFQRLSISGVADKSELQNPEIWQRMDKPKPVEIEKPEIKEISDEERESILQKRHYVVMELVETEKDYVTDLGIVVEEFMADTLEQGLPEPDNGKERVVFGNIKQIYEWHRDVFSKEIEKCLENPDNIGRLFKKYERRLQMYVTYCSNKPLSEFLVHRHKPTFFAEVQEKHGRKLDIAGYLIKPVQRIMKYQLLLKDILKYTDRARLECSALRDAVGVMHVVPKHANDMMTVARMKGFDGRLTAQGKLLLQETFLVRVEEPGGVTGPAKERKVFLFEQIVIFSELVDKKSEEKGFTYKSSIKCINMIMSTVDHDPTRFKLMTSRRAPGIEGNETYELSSESTEIVSTWITRIRELLENQLDFVKALQAPITYQQNLDTSPPHNANSNNNNNLQPSTNPGFKNSTGNLNCHTGGEEDDELITSPSKSVVSSLSDEITNALASKNFDLTEAPSPPWSKEQSSNNENTKNPNAPSGGQDFKTNLSLDLTKSSHNHCDRVNFSPSPIMTPDGVLKLPPLTIPTSVMSVAPATWNLNNVNDNVEGAINHRFPINKGENGFLKKNSSSKADLVKRSSSNGVISYPEESGVAVTRTINNGSDISETRSRMKTTGSVSTPLPSRINSEGQNVKNPSSPDNKKPPTGKEAKKSSKGTKKKERRAPSVVDDQEIEKRRGRAKHRRFPGFFKRSKTADSRLDPNQAESDKSKKAERKGRRSSSPEIIPFRESGCSRNELKVFKPSSEKLTEIEAVRTIHTPSLREAPSLTSIDSKISARSTPAFGLHHVNSTSSGILSATQKESFWLSPVSPATKPGALEVFSYPNSGSTSNVSRQFSKDVPEQKKENDTEENNEKENKYVSMLSAADYSAEKEDEISIKQGDVVQILATNSEGKCLVHRPATQKVPAAEGWIPGHVLGHTSNTLRRSSKKGAISSIESPCDVTEAIVTPRSSQRLKGRRRLRKLSNKTLSAAQSLPSLNDTSEITGSNDEDDSSIISTPTQKIHSDNSRSPWTSLRMRRASNSSRKSSTTSNKLESSSQGLATVKPDSLVFHKQLTDVTVREDESVEFKCAVCGRPKPDIVWKTPNGNTRGARFSTSYSKNNEAILRITKAQIRDTGQYTCTAVNQNETISTSANLIVQGPPGVIRKPKILKAKGSVTVTWEPPESTGNLPLTGYTLEFVQAGSKKWQKIDIADASLTSHLIDHLPAGVLYQFRVIALNSVGESRPSELSQPAVVQNNKSQDKTRDAVVWKNDLDVQYSCTQLVARGRFAVIHELVAISSGNHFAGKYLSKKTTTQAEAENEIKIMRLIRDKNHLITIKDTYITPLAYVIIMPMLSGGRVFDYLLQQKSVKISTLSNIVSQVLDALSYIHSEDIVHLDVKPENLLVRSSSSDLEVFLTDFGDAVHLKHGTTHTHNVTGSPEFTAPEIIRGHPATTAADIWSVGIIAYSLISGFSPFFDDSPEEMCLNISSAKFSFPEEYFSFVSAQAKEFIKSLLVQSPATRPSARNALRHKWLTNKTGQDNGFPTAHLNVFIERRKNQRNSVPMSAFSK